MDDNKIKLGSGKLGQKIRISLKAASLVILEFLKVAIIAGVTIVAVRYFLFKPFYVKGASMEPNFYDHEYLIIDELTYRFDEPARGDVVVFRYPENPKEYFLKRIVGLPGERIKVSAGKVTAYNTAHPEGVEIQESYLPDNLITIGEKFWVLGDNQYFVLGDNRMNSFDSRRFGPVDRNALVGRAWLRGWPLPRIQKFSPPQYNF
ncbi:MAG: signal peptidase I [Candidatus Magasanikbacteria bacterium]|nr:signal peptidase I [Candidatus Magasanikbacteria bacterium]